jgi:hypothetical protein
MSRYHPQASDDTFDESMADEERRQKSLGIHPLQGTCFTEICPECGGISKEWPDRFSCRHCGWEWRK